MSATPSIAPLLRSAARRTAPSAIRALASSTLSSPPCLQTNSQSKLTPPHRHFSSNRRLPAPGAGLLNNLTQNSQSGSPTAYFQRPSLPTNTIIRFVPQQTAWIVERMGKFSRILEPGLAILIPFLDRIAYVKSLKEAALEIPSQSAITADNVTLELDGVLYTRVFDAYNARYTSHTPQDAFKRPSTNLYSTAMAWKTQNMPFPSSRRPRCAQRLAN